MVSVSTERKTVNATCSCTIPVVGWPVCPIHGKQIIAAAAIVAYQRVRTHAEGLRNLSSDAHARATLSALIDRIKEWENPGAGEILRQHDANVAREAVLEAIEECVPLVNVCVRLFLYNLPHGGELDPAALCNEIDRAIREVAA